MIRTFQILILGWLAVWFTGCNKEEEDAIWRDVKIRDLVPSDNTHKPSQLLKTINFNVYAFEIPAEKIGTLDGLWKMLYTEPLQFNDYGAFGANSFLAGFGQIRMHNDIANSIFATGGQRANTASFLLPDGEGGDFAIAGLDNRETISYTSTDGSRETIAMGPGIVSLRIKAQKIPGSRGVCNVDIVPVFTPPVRGPIPQLEGRIKSGEFPFSVAAFRLKMSPGDLVLVGTDKYISDQRSLDGLFFSMPAPSPHIRMFVRPSSSETQTPRLYSGPVVRIYMIVCTRIND